MSYLNVQDRFQIQMRSMEEFIDKENSVRFVDAFVEQLELDKLGFEITHSSVLNSNKIFRESSNVSSDGFFQSLGFYLIHFR